MTCQELATTRFAMPLLGLVGFGIPAVVGAAPGDEIAKAVANGEWSI